VQGYGSAHWCQLKPESPEKSGFYLSLDPPKSPLRRGTKDRTPVPPFLRGARGDLDLIVKQQSLTGFDLKLTPMGSAVSLPRFIVGKRHCRILTLVGNINSDATGRVSIPDRDLD
jgi:hypothetical protein